MVKPRGEPDRTDKQSQLAPPKGLITNLARFNVVHPPRDLCLLEDQRMGFYKLYLFPHGLIKVREFQELDDVGRSRNLLSVDCFCGRLEFLTKLSRRERLHPTVGMVEDSDLACPKQPLGDDQRSD